VAQFKRVQEAFEMLQSKLQEEEQSKLFTTITFTAKIVKCPAPVGFGMVVAEDSKRGGIVAKVSLSLSDLAQRRASGLQEIYDSIVVEAVSPEAGGSLQKGDLIVKIETDDIRCWSLARCRHLSPSRLTSSSGPKAERFQSSCSILSDLYL
jgi:hypothetical protein